MKKKIFFVASATVLFCAVFGAKSVEEARPRDQFRLIVLPAASGPEWEETVDIDATVSEVRRKFGGRIKLAAKKHEVPPEIITAVVVVESLGNPKAVSHKKAYGLMQLKKGTAREMGISDPFHPYENLWAGAKYLKRQWERFGSLELALAAYNMGPNRLSRLLKEGKFDPDYNSYIRRVKIVMMHINNNEG